MNEKVGLAINMYSNSMLPLIFQLKTMLIRYKFVKALNRVESAGKLLVG